MKGQMEGDLQDMEPETSDDEPEVDLEPTAVNGKVAATAAGKVATEKKSGSKSR